MIFRVRCLQVFIGGPGPKHGIENTVSKRGNFRATVGDVVLVAIIQNDSLRIAEGKDGAIAVVCVPELDDPSDWVVSVQIVEGDVELEVPGLEAGGVELGVRCGGEQAVEIQTAAVADTASATPPVSDTSGEADFGIEFSSQTSREGAEIKSVRPHARGDWLGLRAGDVIMEVDGARIRNYADFLRKQRSVDGDKAHLWQVERAGRRFFIAVRNGRKAV